MKRIAKQAAAFLSACCVFVLGAGIYTDREVPDAYYVIEGQENPLESGFLIQTSSSREKVSPASVSGASATYRVSLFGLIPVKDVTVNVIEEKMVLPGGMPFGIKMFTEGVVVVGLSEIDGADGKTKNPAASAGMAVGDVILQIDGTPVNANEQVAELVKKSKGKKMTFRVRRKNVSLSIEVTPVKGTDGGYKAGIWVRDSSAGIGTITFIDPLKGTFGGLGHPVCDADTGQILPLSSGQIVAAEIFGVNKSTPGTAGELRGSFSPLPGSMGTLFHNGETGVYGRLTDPGSISGTAVPVAVKQQIREGEATVLATLNGTIPKEYTIRIETINLADPGQSKNMIIRVTDPALLEQAGGIVQGMSGSPILQNGRLVGAVTHVFVDDPTKGYAIFAENMLETAQSVAKEQLKEAS
ncbi:MAG: SpoIVB peptidase [Oscillospiraceae bacterium]|nr:SpoIVB peptidase [Oscillospiraceae bacterium]